MADTTLSQLISRVSVLLVDSLNRIYSQDTLKEGIRLALNEYSARTRTIYTVEDLDTATATTFPVLHEGLLVIGAAGFATSSRAIDRADSFNLDAALPANLAGWGERQVATFRLILADLIETERLATLHGSADPPYATSNTWQLEDEN